MFCIVYWPVLQHRAVQLICLKCTDTIFVLISNYFSKFGRVTFVVSQLKLILFMGPPSQNFITSIEFKSIVSKKLPIITLNLLPFFTQNNP